MNINKQQLDNVKTQSGLHLVDFYKDNCRPCKMVSLVLKNVLPNYPDVNLHKVQLEEVGEDVFSENSIQSTPTLVLYKDGQEVARQSGFLDPKQMQQFLNV